MADRVETALRQTIAVHSGDGGDLEGLLSLLQRLRSGIQTRIESFDDENGRFRCEIGTSAWTCLHISFYMEKY